MLNKYGAKCHECSVWVEAGAGEARKVEGKWRVFHTPPCPTGRAATVPAKPAAKAANRPGLDAQIAALVREYGAISVLQSLADTLRDAVTWQKIANYVAEPTTLADTSPGPVASRRIADRIDGYDRDDLGETPDF